MHKLGTIPWQPRNCQAGKGQGERAQCSPGSFVLPLQNKKLSSLGDTAEDLRLYKGDWDQLEGEQFSNHE